MRVEMEKSSFELFRLTTKKKFVFHMSHLRFYLFIRNEKVIAFCDVDIKKIGSYYVDLETKRPIPITSFSTVIPPVVIWLVNLFDPLICWTSIDLLSNSVALDRTSGEFEKNLASMQWTESVDFWHLY